MPPIIVALATNPFFFEVFDLSSVNTVVNGAAGLDRGLLDKLHAQQPNWKILTAYGSCSCLDHAVTRTDKEYRTYRERVCRNIYQCP